jgi:hypothetical protein
LDQWLTEINQADDPKNAPCLPELTAQVFWNTLYSVTGAFEKNPEKRVLNYPPSNAGGFANNPDTKYMTMPFSFDYGEVIVIRAKMPTHPYTRRGNSMLPAELTQVQYFSISTAAAPPSGEGWDTVFDEQIPLDEKGYFTAVVAWPWNRPVNATLENGIVYLHPGDGEGHYVGARNWLGMLYIRYQNCDKDWTESPTKIPMPTIENPIPQDPIVMGSYYPIGKYMSKIEFEETYFKK